MIAANCDTVLEIQISFKQLTVGEVEMKKFCHSNVNEFYTLIQKDRKVKCGDKINYKHVIMHKGVKCAYLRGNTVGPIYVASLFCEVSMLKCIRHSLIAAPLQCPFSITFRG